jgi:glycosyltransferase involved in cell wall biosynthesis
VRVLFVVPYAPSPIRVRPYSLLRGLLRRGHEVTVLTPLSGAAEQVDLVALEALGARVIAVPLTKGQSQWSCLRALPTCEPLQAAYSWSPALVRRLADEAPRHDVAHVEHLRGARYALALRGSIPLVWDAVDCISLLFEQAAARSRTLFGRWITKLELPRTRAFEARMVAAIRHVLVSAPVDRASLVALTQRSDLEDRITVLRNGVDTDYYRARREPTESNSIIFSGKLNYHANATAALHLIEQVMPRLWRHHPTARLLLVGQQPGAALRSAVGRDERLGLRANVPDVRPYLERAAVAVAPLVYGAGIQNKVLEAMSMHRPVVATSIASRALQAAPGSDYLLADTPDELAQSIGRLLDDAELRARTAQNGRRYVERQHQWDQITAELEAVYEAAQQERLEPG